MHAVITIALLSFVCAALYVVLSDPLIVFAIKVAVGLSVGFTITATVCLVAYQLTTKLHR
jgi:hypothetical protein